MSEAVVEAISRSYTVGGARVTFACADREIASRIAAQVAGWHFTAVPESERTGFVLSFSREAAPPVAQEEDTFAVHRGRCFYAGDSWYLSSSDSRMRVHPPSARRIDVWLGTDTLQDSIDFARILFYATQAALRQCGLYELHAAAVIDPQQQAEARNGGVLIIGPSGSGKTTLAMRLTAAGWKSVADDLVLVRNDPAAAEAFAFRRVFAATDTTLAGYPQGLVDSATTEPNAFEPLKRRIDPDVLFPGMSASSCTPGVLLFPSITGEPESEAHPLAASDSLTRLLKMCPWASYDRAVARPHLEALASLARQCASYELRAGTDLLQDPVVAPRLFARLATGAR